MSTPERPMLEVLLVDDNEDDILLARRAFDRSRLRLVHCARSGPEALAYLRGEGEFRRMPCPALVILDLNMPGLTGLEVLEALKTDETLRAIPVLVFTASNRPEDVEAAYSAGAATFLRKPISLEQFRVTVRELEQYWTAVADVPLNLGRP
ncbi:MAG: response regulator [Gemmatimonadales bacterium]